jgi:hypothetical protein
MGGNLICGMSCGPPVLEAVLAVVLGGVGISDASRVAVSLGLALGWRL